jgi:hypothetical protein
MFLFERFFELDVLWGRLAARGHLAHFLHIEYFNIPAEGEVQHGPE